MSVRFCDTCIANNYNVHIAHGLSMIEWQIIHKNFSVQRRRFHFDQRRPRNTTANQWSANPVVPPRSNNTLYFSTRTKKRRNSQRISEWHPEQIASNWEDKVQTQANNTGLSQNRFPRVDVETRCPRDNATNEWFQHTSYEIAPLNASCSTVLVQVCNTGWQSCSNRSRTIERSL